MAKEGFSWKEFFIILVSVVTIGAGGFLVATSSGDWFKIIFGLILVGIGLGLIAGKVLK